MKPISQYHFFVRLRQRGMTLMETVAVLGVGAIVVAGALSLYSLANTSLNVSEGFSDLSNVQRAVRNVYSGQSDYAGLTVESLTSNLALPASMGTGTTITHSFNGPINVAPADAGGGANSGFSVEFEGLPAEACTQMVTKDLGRGLSSMTVDGGTPQTSTVPLTPAQAATACGNGRDSEITWVFY